MPIHVTGTHAAMPPGRNWPKRKPGRVFSRRHDVTVRFGEPIWPGKDEHRTHVMARVRSFLTGEPVPEGVPQLDGAAHVPARGAAAPLRQHPVRGPSPTCRSPRRSRSWRR